MGKTHLYMPSFIRRFVAIASLGSLAFMTGCGGSLESWIVSTRNHQGDLALDSRRYKEAVLAYRLALQLDPTNEHAKAGFVESAGDQAEKLLSQSHYEDALEELAPAMKVDAQSVRLGGIKSDIENAQLKSQIVLSNYPAYQTVAHSIMESYKSLNATNNEVLYRITRFGRYYDVADLTIAIHNSTDLESEVGKLTARLTNLRSAVSVGSAASEPSNGLVPASGGSVLPLP